jgi:hypothetical protein
MSDKPKQSPEAGATTSSSLADNEHAPGDEPTFSPELGPAQLLHTWLRRVYAVLAAHHSAAAKFERRHYLIGIPSVSLSAAVGTTIFATLLRNPEPPAQVAVGLGSVCAAVLTCLLTFLRYDQRAEKHRRAAVKFGILMRELEQQLSLPCSSREELLAFVDGIRKRWDELNEQGPTMPSKVWSQTAGGRGYYA